ncbi:MAG: hypothetical protein Q8Q41_01275 [bacterium]|nr:hypothetical protein [bacterium]
MDRELLIQEFDYRIAWRSREPRPGSHRSLTSGGGFEFRGYAPLVSADDVRNYDIGATLRDPFRRPQARVVRQRSAITVYGVADLSASMAFGAKLRSLATFVASLAYSVYRTHDLFGFVGCDTEVREEFLTPPGRAKSVVPELGARLIEFAPRGRNAEGLGDAHRFLKRRRSLVFLVSDFLFSRELLTDVLRSLSHHDVVPVVIRDSSEFSEVPKFGIARLRDLETATERYLFVASRLRRRIRNDLERREAELGAVFEAHDTRPFYLVDEFDPEKIAEHFLAG